MFERRLHVLMGSLGFFFLILAGRFFYLQVIRGDYYLQSVRQNKRQIHYFKGERGRILDRNAVVLARNRQSRDISIVMARITKRTNRELSLDRPIARILVSNLSDLMGIERQKIWNRLDKIFLKVERKPFVFKGETIFDAIVLFSDVGDDLARIIEVERYETVRENSETTLVDRFPGVEITTTRMRVYPYGREMCHILGYTGKMSEEEKKQFNRTDIYENERIGKIGIERFYEESLHGFTGAKMVDKVIRDKKIVYDVLRAEPPKSGDDLQLTIDIRLQQIVVDVLDAFQIDNPSLEVKGSCVILDPRNGQVLAMVSYPFYDVNDFIPSITKEKYDALLKHPGKPLLNRSIRGYPPGSTYKPLMAVACSAEGVNLPKVTCLSSITLGSGRSAATFRCWKRVGHGDIDLQGSLRESCNVYYYELGQKLGINTMHHYADLFGFGHKTGLDLARAPDSETAGINPSPDWKRTHNRGGWVPGDTLNTSIGQGFVSASPLQIARYTGIVATSGKVTIPHLLIGSNEHSFNEIDSILDYSDFVSARRGMHQVTMDKRGTAYGPFFPLQSLGVDSAGKTGSAEVGKNKRTHSWYCGFCPFIDPVLSYAIVVENAGHGSDAAAPIMADIMRRVYSDNTLRSDLGLKKKEYFVPIDQLYNVDRDFHDLLPVEEDVEIPPFNVIID